MKIDMRLFLFLCVTFVIISVAGIISHEYGHWFAHKFYGIKSHVRASDTRIDRPSANSLRYMEMQDQYADEIARGVSFPQQDEYEKLAKATAIEGAVVSAAGPAVTWLFVMIALSSLFILKRRTPVKHHWSFLQWLLACTAALCTRNLYIIVVAIIQFTRSRYKNIHGDEFLVADSLGWNPWSIPIAMTLLSIVVLVAIFKLINTEKRTTFFIALVLGELTVLYGWCIVVGPKIMN